MGPAIADEYYSPAGNAFNLLGHFQRAAREQGWTEREIKDVIDKATSADYEHLLQTLIKHTEPDRE